MPRDEERINFTLPRETKEELLAIVESHRRNLSQELKLLIECFIAIQKNNGVIHPDLTVSKPDELMNDENKVRQIALDVFRELGSGAPSSMGIDVLSDVKLKYKHDGEYKYE